MNRDPYEGGFYQGSSYQGGSYHSYEGHSHEGDSYQSYYSSSTTNVFPTLPPNLFHNLHVLILVGTALLPGVLHRGVQWEGRTGKRKDSH